MSNPAADQYRKLVANSFTFRLYLIKAVPMAFLAGLRVKEITEERAVVTVPYKFLNKNPFRSMYFAVESMAAEFSTGILCVTAVYKAKPAVATLVLGLEGSFTKKAVGLITFKCNDGQMIADAVQKAKDTGEAVSVTATSIGTDETGEQVAEFKFTWSFKAISN